MRTWFSLVQSISALVLIGLSIPLMRGKVPRNRWYGFRTRRTLADDRVWFPANRAAGRYQVLAGLVALLLVPALWLPGLGREALPLVLLGGLVVPIVGALVASLVVLRRLPDPPKS